MSVFERCTRGLPDVLERHRNAGEQRYRRRVLNSRAFETQYRLAVERSGEKPHP